jgi:hypothetical protein
VSTLYKPMICIYNCIAYRVGGILKTYCIHFACHIMSSLCIHTVLYIHTVCIGIHTGHAASVYIHTVLDIYTVVGNIFAGGTWGVESAIPPRMTAHLFLQ